MCETLRAKMESSEASNAAELQAKAYALVLFIICQQWNALTQMKLELRTTRSSHVTVSDTHASHSTGNETHCGCLSRNLVLGRQ